MKNNNFFLSWSIIFVLLTSFIFALLIGEGLYGFGADYYVIYYENNLNFGSFVNRLGWIISTFTLNGVHLGVHISTFFLSLSFGMLLRLFFHIKKLDSLLIFLTIFIIGIHTWPIIMSTSNAMRQGLGMSMIFFALCAYIDRQNLLFFIFIFISIFMHKTCIFFASIFLFSIFVLNLMSKSKNFSNKLFIFFGIIIFLYTSLIIHSYEDATIPSKIIEKDYRYPMILISIFYVLIAHSKNNFLKNYFNIFLYLFIFGSFSLFFLQLNWEYERLMMMMLIPIILSIGSIFKKKSAYIYYSVAFSSLLILTISNGMYQSFQ